MQRINISAPAFAYDEGDPDGYRSGMQRLGTMLGAAATGLSVYELPPGQALCPYHYEYGEEEWLVVVEGRPTLRHPGGSEVLRPWDVVLFPQGPEGAHKVTNATDATARVLMFSSIADPAATVYPDSDKIAVWPRNRDDRLIAHRRSGVGYWDGEVPEAPGGGAGHPAFG